MKTRVSIRDVAQKVGMHHTTVSLALRESPLLKKETREKIRAVAEELGYKPDPMLSALTAYRQSKRKASFHAVIAWINNWPDRGALLANPVYRGYFDGAFHRASELGYALQEFWLHEANMTAEKLKRILHARNISGLLIAPQPQSQVHVGIDFQDFSAVTFGYSLQPRNLHLVTNHHAQTLDLMIGKLVELGYRRPGYCILPSSDAGGNYIWISRILYLYSQHPELVQIPRAVSLKKEDLARWMKKHRPDVLIGFSDLLSEVEEMGYRVPDRIGFASMAVDANNPRVSGVNQNDHLIGKTALEVLVGMIQRGERGIPEVPIRTLVDSSWFHGETLEPQKQRSRRLIPNPAMVEF